MFNVRYVCVNVSDFVCFTFVIIALFGIHRVIVLTMIMLSNKSLPFLLMDFAQRNRLEKERRRNFASVRLAQIFLTMKDCMCVRNYFSFFISFSYYLILFLTLGWVKGIQIFTWQKDKHETKFMKNALFQWFLSQKFNSQIFYSFCPMEHTPFAKWKWFSSELW